MSDNWITIIPLDSQFIPAPLGIERARDLLAVLATNAEEIEVIVSEDVKFFDCGENFMRVICPACQTEISLLWWQEVMEEDYGEQGFRLRTLPIPCCGALLTLNDLIYDWPQGFARFAIDVMNPMIGRLKDCDVEQLERLLGTKLRVIYQHI